MRFQQEIDDYKTKVLSSFSHELRTPLNGAISPLQFALADQRIPEVVKHDSIENSLISLFLLENTLNDIVDLSLILSNQFELIINEFSFFPLVNEIRYIVHKQLKIKEILLYVCIQENFPETITTDRKRLKQILLNLITNAIKFTSQNGTIILRVSLQLEEIQFELEDNGIGIDEKRLLQLQSLLKKPEFTVSSRLTVNSTGCCLGLLISQNLALKLNQANSKGISVISTTNLGSIFSFAIEKQYQRITVQSSSCQQNQNELSFEESDQEIQFVPNFSTVTQFLTENKNNLLQCQSNQREEFILIVDDDCFNLMAVELNLNKLKKQCIKAYNGQEAIDILVEVSSQNDKYISLILMDYQMPVMDGVEATKQIQQLIKNEIIPEIPIIACTAYGAKEHIKQCLEAGMAEYLIKPITHENITQILKKYKIN